MRAATPVGEVGEPGRSYRTLLPYVPRLTVGWAASAPERAARTVDGSLLFVDISGFTKMSERLARHGKVGAEEVTDAIGTCFEALLEVAYRAGGGLLKFGGDALLLLFTDDGHAERAAGAALGMQARLADVGRLDTTAGRVVLRMSAGVHTGAFACFLVGESHRELLLTGAAVSTLTDMEGAARAGQVVVSEATANALPSQLVGEAQGPGYRLRRVKRLHMLEEDRTVPASIRDVDLAGYVPTAIRAHLLSGGEEPEHRQATVAFLHFDGTDELLEREGADVLADALRELVADVQTAADEHEVTFLGTDIDHNGGKIILVAGVPRAMGDDEERMLGAVRQIADGTRRLPVRIGVHRGPIFAGDVGPRYRRTYTVMGDTVNLAARLMARAEPGQVLATAPVLDRSRATFETTELEPFLVKGKRHPVEAFAVGAVQRRVEVGIANLPLVGRDDEIAAFDEGLDALRAGHGRMIELVGDPGIGKSRLIEELRARAGGLKTFVIACDPYEATTPYTPFWWLLHDLLGLPETAAPDLIAERLRGLVETRCPDLLPWLPLLGTPLDLDIADTMDTAALAPEFRRERVHETMAVFLDRALPDEVLVILEDVHWMDEASSAVLRIIVENLEPRATLICATRRNVETGFLAPDLPHVRSLRPAPLTPEQAVAALVAATEDSPLRPHDVETLAARSAGNPLFLTELMQAASTTGDVDSLPDSIDAVITAQIDRLPTVQRRLLRYASVLGHTFRVDELTALLGDEVPAPDEATWRSLDSFLGFVAKDVVRFHHALLRDTAYEELPFRRRRELHARAGDGIAAGLGDHPESEAELLSLHFFHAQRYREAWRYARIAGVRARDKYANVEAAELLERAIAAARRVPELPNTEVAEIWEALGDVHERSGVYDRALAAYRSARRTRAGDPVGEAGLLLKEAWIAEHDGRYSQAIRVVRRGFRTLAGIDQREALQARARLGAWYAAVRQAQGRSREAVRACHEAIDDAVASGNLAAEAHARFILDWAYVELGQPELATHSARALEIYEQLGDLEGQAGVLNNLGGFAYFEGHWDDAIALYERGRDTRLRTGNAVMAALASCNIGEVLTDQGRLEEAETAFRNALRVFRAAEYSYGIATAAQHLGRIATRAGDYGTAFAFLEDARAQFDDIGAAGDVQEVDVLIAECHLAAGNPARALDVVAATTAANREAGVVRVAALERIRGHALLALDDAAAARTALEVSLAEARSGDALYEIALVLDVLVDLDVREGDLASAEARETECAEILERLGVRVGPGRRESDGAGRTRGLPTPSPSRMPV
ncbi:MAG: adenylate/guanylate cyclase domain-containing protein [Acidimicrobiia bacterium]